jgi:hypothetical protein
MEVILEKSGAFLSRTFSDNEGHFKFINLPDGEYVVIVRLEGYEELREIPNFGRDLSATMNLVMTRKNAVEPDSSKLLYASYPAKIVDDYQKALDEGRKGNAAGAIKILEGVVKAAPDFHQAHNALGTFYQRAGRFQDAEKGIQHRPATEPHSAEPLVNLGSLYIQIAEQAQAKRDTSTFGAALDEASPSTEIGNSIRTRIRESLLLPGHHLLHRRSVHEGGGAAAPRVAARERHGDRRACSGQCLYQAAEVGTGPRLSRCISPRQSQGSGPNPGFANARQSRRSKIIQGSIEVLGR